MAKRERLEHEAPDSVVRDRLTDRALRSGQATTYKEARRKADQAIDARDQLVKR